MNAAAVITIDSFGPSIPEAVRTLALEHSGHCDVFLTARAMDDLVQSRDDRDCPVFGAPLHSLLGVPLADQTDGSAIWPLATVSSEILRRALSLLRQTLLRLGSLGDYQRLEREVRQIEAVRDKDRAAILKAIDTAKSVEDMIDRFAALES